MVSLTITTGKVFLVTCLLYHVTLVTSIEDYIKKRDISPAARKCFKEEEWPCALPLTEFPWNQSRFDAYLMNSRIPAAFPENQTEEYKSFLGQLKKTKVFSLLGSCMGYGHRVPLLRELFGFFFGSMEPLPEDPRLKISYTKFLGIPIKLYRPTAAHTGPRAAIFYIHGGGWTLGSADEMDGITRRMALEGDFVVASVDYRLAPENLFPKGLDDCMKAIKYFLKHADNFGVDGNRVAVSGDSSGGNLAAAVALRLRNEKMRPKLKMQALIYPVLQAFDFNTPSYQEHTCDPYLDRSWMISFWMWYAFGNMPTSMLPILTTNAHTTAKAKDTYGEYVSQSVLPASSRQTYSPTNVVVDGNATVWNHLKPIFTNEYFSPLLAKTLAGLPHTYFFSCEQDVLRDEGFMYIARLRAAGVKVEHAHYQALHALVDNLSVPFASDAVNVMVAYLKRNL